MMCIDAVAASFAFVSSVRVRNLLLRFRIQQLISCFECKSFHPYLQVSVHKQVGYNCHFTMIMKTKCLFVHSNNQ